VDESDALLKLARFASAAEVALRGLGPARQAGLEAAFPTDVLAANAAEALLARGRTAEAAALIDPRTTGPPDRLHWAAHEARAEIDLLRGDIEAATARRQQIDAPFADVRHAEFARETALRAVDLELWAGRPGDALDRVRRALQQFKDPALAIFCGRLLAGGMRACADLAERARARRDEPAAEAAATAAVGLASWADQMGGAPLTDHPFVATIPAERATWDAERTRLTGVSDPAAWSAAAKAWQELDCPHRAGYAWWRYAQAQLNSGQSRVAVAAEVQAAAALADGHAPLLWTVRALAERARIPLQVASTAPRTAPGGDKALASYGLTDREVAVLRLLAAGRTNAQIGAELYISYKTASVHVSNILRKLGVSGRAEAAALAERAGLLTTQSF
jgi:DNA-binding CsgD family transcriptional regulator